MTRGKQPRAEHCFMMEKVPVIMAWLPTTAARIAITKTGHLNFSRHDNTSASYELIWNHLHSSESDEIRLKILTWYRDVEPDLTLYTVVL